MKWTEMVVWIALIAAICFIITQIAGCEKHRYTMNPDTARYPLEETNR